MLFSKLVYQFLKELSVSLASCCGFTNRARPNLLLAPIVRRRDWPKLNGRRRVVNLKHLDDDAEELGVLVTVEVEPVKCLTVLVADLGSKPNNRSGIES